MRRRTHLERPQEERELLLGLDLGLRRIAVVQKPRGILNGTRLSTGCLRNSTQ